MTSNLKFDYKLAKNYLCQTKYQQAMPIFKKCIERGHVRACFVLGAIFEAGQHDSKSTPDYQNAGDYYLKAAGAKFPDAEAMISLGLLIQEQKYSDVKKRLPEFWFQQAIKKSKTGEVKCTAVINLVSYYHTKEQYQNSLDCLKKNWQENDGEFYAWRAMSQYKLGKRDVAIRDMEKAKEHGFSQADAYLKKFKPASPAKTNPSGTPVAVRHDGLSSLGLTPYLSRHSAAKKKYFEIKQESAEDHKKIKFLSEKLEVVASSLAEERKVFINAEVEYKTRIQYLYDQTVLDNSAVEAFKQQVVQLGVEHAKVKGEHFKKTETLIQEHKIELQKLGELHVQREAIINKQLQETKVKHEEKRTSLVSGFQENRKVLEDQISELKKEIAGLTETLSKQAQQFDSDIQIVKQHLASLSHEMKTREEEIEKLKEQNIESSEVYLQLGKVKGLLEQETEVRENLQRELEALEKSNTEMSDQYEKNIQASEEQAKKAYQTLKDLFEEEKRLHQLDDEKNAEKLIVIEAEKQSLRERFEKVLHAKQASEKVVAGLTITIQQQLRLVSELEEKQECYQNKIAEQAALHDDNAKSLSAKLLLLQEQEISWKAEKASQIAEIERLQQVLQDKKDEVVTLQDDGAEKDSRISALDQQITEIEKRFKEQGKRQKEEILKINTDHAKEINLLNQTIKEAEELYLQERVLIEDAINVLMESNKDHAAEIDNLKKRLAFQESEYSKLQEKHRLQGEQYLLAQERIETLTSELDELQTLQAAKPGEMQKIREIYSSKLAVIADNLKKEQMVTQNLGQQLIDSRATIEKTAKKLRDETEKLHQQYQHKILCLEIEQEAKYRANNKALEIRSGDADKLEEQLTVLQTEKGVLDLRYEQLEHNFNQSQKALSAAREMLVKQKEVLEKLTQSLSEKTEKAEKNKGIIDALRIEQDYLNTKISDLEEELEDKEQEYVLETEALSNLYQRNLQHETEQHEAQLSLLETELQQIKTKLSAHEQQNQEDSDDIQRLEDLVKQKDAEIEEIKAGYDAQIVELREREALLTVQNEKLGQLVQARFTELLQSKVRLIQFQIQHRKKVEDITTDNQLLLQEKEKLAASIIVIKEKTEHALVDLSVAHQAELDLLHQEENTLSSALKFEKEKMVHTQKEYEEERRGLYAQLAGKGITRQQLEQLQGQHQQLRESYASQKSQYDAGTQSLKAELAGVQIDKQGVVDELVALKEAQVTLKREHAASIEEMKREYEEKGAEWKKELVAEKKRVTEILEEKETLRKAKAALQKEYEIEKTKLAEDIAAKATALETIKSSLTNESDEKGELTTKFESLTTAKTLLEEKFADLTLTHAQAKKDHAVKIEQLGKEKRETLTAQFNIHGAEKEELERLIKMQKEQLETTVQESARVIQEKKLEISGLKEQLTGANANNKQLKESLQKKEKALEHLKLDQEALSKRAESEFDELKKTHKAEIEKIRFALQETIDSLEGDKQHLFSQLEALQSKLDAAEKCYEAARSDFLAQLKNKEITQQQLKELRIEHEVLRKNYELQKSQYKATEVSLKGELAGVKKDKQAVADELVDLKETQKRLAIAHITSIEGLKRQHEIEIRGLQDLLAIETQRVKEISEEKEALRKTKEALQKKYEIEKTKLAEDIAAKTTALETTKSSLTNESDEKGELTTKFESLTTAKTLLEEKFADLTLTYEQAQKNYAAKIAKLDEEKREALAAQLTIHQAEQEKSHALITRQQEVLETAERENKQAITAKETEITNLTGLLTTAGTDKTKIALDLQSKESELAALKKAKEQSEQSAKTHLDELKKTHKAEIEKIRFALQETIDSLEGDKQHLFSQLEALQSKLDAAAKCYEAARSDFLAQLKNKEITQQQLEQLQTQHRELREFYEAKKSQYGAETQSLKSELAVVKTAKKNVDDELVALKQTQETLQKEYVTSVGEIKRQYDEKEAEWKKELVAEKQHIAEISEEKEALRNAKKALQKEHDAEKLSLNNRIANKDSEISDLQSSLTEESGTNEELLLLLDAASHEKGLLQERLDDLKVTSHQATKDHSDKIKQLEAEQRDVLEVQAKLHEKAQKDSQSVLRQLQEEYRIDTEDLRNQLADKSKEISRLLSSTEDFKATSNDKIKKLVAEITEFKEKYRNKQQRYRKDKEVTQKKYEASIQEWKEYGDGLKNSLKKVQQALETQKGVNSALSMAHEDVQRELGVLKDQFVNNERIFQSEKARLETHILTLEGANKTLNGVVQDLNVKLELLKKTDEKYTQLKTLKESLEETLNAVRKEKTDLEKELGFRERAHQKTVTEYEEALQQKEGAHEKALLDQQQSFERAQKDFEGRISALRNEVGQLKGEKSKLRGQFGEQQGKHKETVATLEEQARNKQLEVDTLKLNVRHNAEQIRKAAQENEKIKKELSDTRGAFDIAERQYKKQLEDISQCAKKKIEDAEKLYRDKKESIQQQLTKYKNKKDDEIKVLQTNLENSLRDYDVLKNKHVQTERRNSFLGKENAKAGLLQPQLENAKEDLAGLTRRLKRQSDELSTAQQESAKAARQLKTLEKKNRELQTEIEVLREPKPQTVVREENEPANRSSVSLADNSATLFGQSGKSRDVSRSSSRRRSLRVQGRLPADSSSVLDSSWVPGEAAKRAKERRERRKVGVGAQLTLTSSRT